MVRGQYTFEPGVPPAEIRLWRKGENPTDMGVHLWTERSAAEVWADYQARGNLLQLDVEHNASDLVRKENEGRAPAEEPTAGYAALEIRDGEPWLRFEWSAYAVEQIETKQRRYLSPEYVVDKGTGEILRLVRVSLVGDPATHDAPMLASREVAAAQARASRRAAALRGVATSAAVRPASEAPPEVLAIVKEAPLSWRYDDPVAVGGWLGAIEPEDESWIAFVATGGKVLLWTERDQEGGVSGEPVRLWRFDLALGAPGKVQTTTLADAASPQQQERSAKAMNDREILMALLAAAVGATTSADPDIQSMGVSVATAVNDVAAQKQIDLSAPPPPAAEEPPMSQPGGEMAGGAGGGVADPGQQMAAADCEKPMAAAAQADGETQQAARPAQQAAPKVDPQAGKVAAAALAQAGGAVAWGGITIDAVRATSRAIAREESERTALIAANAVVLGPLAPLLVGKPIHEVKSFIAARRVEVEKAQKAEAGKAPQGEQLGETVQASKSVSVSARYFKAGKAAAA